MIWPDIKVREVLNINVFHSIFEARRSADYAFEGESHNFWECLYVKSGRLCVSGDERVYNMGAGEIIFHKPLEFHKYNVLDECGADLLIFSFSTDSEAAEYFKNSVFNLTPSQRKIVSDMLSYIHEKCPYCETAEENLYLDYFEKIPTFSQMVRTYIYQLFLSLSDLGKIALASTSRDASLFGKAVNYMNLSVCKQPTVDEIAAFCNISTSTLKRIFLKYAGISVHKYFLLTKLKAANALLLEGLNVSETAEKLGFSSQAYFSAAFKREFHINPSKIRAD
ncbi:MAG: AraC family transcriptional regulator [Clostridia bacterium]|nr:AraC family transcriptional regulator [Clostridia bacterium]